MILKIRKTTDPILREPTEEVVDFGHEMQFLIDNMIETMRHNKGVGLAAPQIGVSKKIFICEFEGEEGSDYEAFPLTVICNPKITAKSKEEINMVEGCLSFPGMEILAKRPKEITIEGKDRYGKELKINAGNLFARVLQHENDHLNSTLLIDHIQETSVVFIGTGSLGKKALELLANDIQYNILSVITSKEKKITRRSSGGSNNEIKTLAKKLNLPIFEVDTLDNKEFINKLKELKPDLGVMADFGKILPVDMLSIPKHGIVNIHPSLLPKYRGPSPIQATILNGDEVAGVTLMLTSKKMDAGDIISQTAVKISPSETSTTLKELLSDIGATLLLNTLPYYLAGDLKPEKQDESKATITKIIMPSDGLIDAKASAKEIERKIRAFDNWPKVYTIMSNGKRIQIISAYMDENGGLCITRVKPEGKKEMSYEEFKNGYKTELTFK